MKKTIILLITTVLFFTGCKTQKNSTQKITTETEDASWEEKAVQALNDRKFILEAEKIYFKSGDFTYVTANTNFISMHEDKATIQMAFNSPPVGSNGIGGITLDGRVSNIKMDTDKKGVVTFSMMVQGTGISANVLIKLYKGDNRCDATITPNFNSNKISFSGNLYKEEDSNVFKGRAL